MSVETIEGWMRRDAAAAPSPDAPVRLLLFEPVTGGAARAREQVEGVSVLVAETEAEAVELVTAGGFDLVVVDLATAGPGGLSTVTVLRERAPQVPVVVLTDDDGDDWGAEVLRSGAEGHLLKGEVGLRALAQTARQFAARSGSRGARSA